MPKWKIAISIDKRNSTPVYKQISHAIIRAIESGRLASGTSLPGSRTLAEILKVNRNTVVQSYEDLLSQGWIDFHQGKGPKVSAGAVSSRSTFSSSPKRKVSEVKETTLYKLKLTDGLPDSRLFPMEVFLRTFGRTARLYGRRLYSEDIDPKGLLVLRESIAEMLQLTRGMNVASSEILITRGSLQAIYLLGLSLKRL